MKQSKRMKEGRSKIEPMKTYQLAEAVELVKETSKVKFDASVEVHVNLTIDPKKSDQLVRASVSLPHGTGKSVRVAAFVGNDKAAKAKAAGADPVGSKELIEKIKQTGKCDFDVAVATPDMMRELASIARVLGQKGLMPNPKTGTITTDVEKTIKELQAGKLSYKNDNSGTVHVPVGKVSFDSKNLLENLEAFIDSLKKSKPDGVKGTFIKNAYLTSSMGPSVRIAI